MTFAPAVTFLAGVLAISALAAGPPPEEKTPQPGAVWRAEAPADRALPTPAELAAKMRASIHAGPFLRVRERVTSDAGGFDQVAWMSKTRVRIEVRQDGKLVYAHSVDGRRTREFVPRAVFKNGADAVNVIVEYDADLEDVNAGWPKLINTDLACNTMGSIGDTWLKVEEPSIPSMWAEGMAGCVVEEGYLGDRPAYRLTARRELEPGRVFVKEYYLDRDSCLPVRDVSTTTLHGKVVNHRRGDLVIEHLATDEGIAWRLELGQLGGGACGTE